MRASLCWLALALCWTPSHARADATERWGVLVYDEAGDLVTTRWSNRTLMIGSGPDCDVILSGLEAHHIVVSPMEDLHQWLVAPVKGAQVRFAEALSGEATPLPVNAVFWAGSYKITIIGLEDPPEIALDPIDVGEQAAAARRAEFEKTAYRFCHEPDYGKNGVVGADFCAILDEKSVDVCPEAHAHCAEWEELESPAARAARLSGKGKDGKAGSRRTAQRRETIRLPQLPAPIAYGIIGLLLAGLVFWFVQALRTAGWERDGVALDEVPIDAAARNLQALPEARASQLLQAAERAYERGEHADAAIYLHLATLRHLDDEGLARYHASKTNGDYLRAIRRHKPLAALLRGIANQTERIRFGDGQVEAPAIPGLLERARQLLVKGSTIPDAAPGLLLLLFTSLAATQGCLPSEDPSKAYYEYGPSGMSALPDVLEAAGLKVEVARTRLIDVPADVGAVVLRTSAAAHKTWPKNLSADGLLDRGLSVVVIDDLGRSPWFLPVTSTTTGPRGRAVELEVYADAEQSCVNSLIGLDEQAGLDPVKIPTGARLRRSRTSTTVTITKHPFDLFTFIAEKEDRGENWMEATGIAMALLRYDENSDEVLPGCLYLFADRDLYTNASLTRAPNARFVGQFFARVSGGRKIMFLDRLDDWATSSGDDQEQEEGGGNPSKALKASNMLPLLLQAFATLALFYVFVGAAFGRLRDPVRREHKNFVEHVEAIGRHYAAAGNAGLTHSAQSLARVVVMRSRDRLRSAGTHAAAGGWAGLAQDLARQHQLPEDDVRAALRLGIDGVSDLGAPSPNDPAPASERMLKTLSRLLSGRSEKLQPKAKRRPKGAS